MSAEPIAIFERFSEAEFRADLDVRQREHGDDGVSCPLPRAAGQRRFDALVSIFRARVVALAA